MSLFMDVHNIEGGVSATDVSSPSTAPSASRTSNDSPVMSARVCTKVLPSLEKTASWLPGRCEMRFAGAEPGANG